MNRCLTTLGALALACLPATARPAPGIAIAPGGEDWQADFDQATEIAQREKKDMLVEFTGSDWCPPCKLLASEVFTKAQFLDAAKKDYVLVKLDFPRSEEVQAKVPNPERNREIQVKYGVEGFPTVLLMTPDGVVYGQTGYRPGGAESYVEHLRELRVQGKAELERIAGLVEDHREAKGAERAAAAEVLLEELQRQGPGSAFGPMLASVLGGVLREEASDELKRKVLRGLIAAGQVDEGVVAIARGMDPENEEGLYQEAVFAMLVALSSEEQIPGALKEIEGLLATEKIRDGRELDLRVAAADWNQRFIEDKDAARRHARRALELAPADNEGLQAFLKEILEGE